MNGDSALNYDLVNLARQALGRALIRAGRGLSHAGARLLQHPAAQKPPLRAVDNTVTPFRYSPRRDAL